MKNKNKRTKMPITWKGKTIAFFLGLTVFMGVTSVLAEWPVPPTGENVGGWLGKIFNLNESDGEKLALNSKKIVLPSDSSAISENKQVPTKEYVDERVSAAGTTGGAGGGGAFTLVGGIDSVPSCPSGYASAMDGYWNCGFQENIDIGCFCGAKSSYSAYSSWKASSTTNHPAPFRYYRCAICYPGTNGVGSESTVLWITTNTYDGDLGGRTGADEKCVADQPDYLKDKCSNVHAFLSVDATDEIRDMPNCDMDMDGSVQSWYDCQSTVYWFARQYNQFTMMAFDWLDLSDGAIFASADSASVYSPLSEYWTGSKSDLSLNSENCDGWENGLSGYGYGGKPFKSDGLWMTGSSKQCMNSNPLLCACQID